MKRILILFGFMLAFGALLVLHAGAESRTVTFYNGTVAVINGTAEENSSLTLPKGPEMGAREFVGWLVREGDGSERLLTAGSSYTVPAGTQPLRFDAFGVELRCAKGASVTLASPAKLRFYGGISLADHQRLCSLLGTENVSFGVLIAPYATAGTAPFERDSALQGLLDRTSESFYFTNNGFGIFAGQSDPITDDCLLEKYCGRAYIALRIGTQLHYVYADYTLEDHVRTAYGVTARAFEDRSATATARHIAQSDAGCYSPLTQDKLLLLRARLDRVIYVSMLEEGTVQSRYSADNLKFTDFNSAHYTSPYQVVRTEWETAGGIDNYVTYVITGKDGADFNTVTAYFIGGSYRPADRLTEWRADGIYIKVRTATIN